LKFEFWPTLWENLVPSPPPIQLQPYCSSNFSARCHCFNNLYSVIYFLSLSKSTIHLQIEVCVSVWVHLSVYLHVRVQAHIWVCVQLFPYFSQFGICFMFHHISTSIRHVICSLILGEIAVDCREVFLIHVIHFNSFNKYKFLYTLLHISSI
jgi:hypothetical protein